MIGFMGFRFAEGDPHGHQFTREELIALAHIWLKRAAKLESELLNQQKNTLPHKIEKLLVDGADISVPPGLAD